VAILLAYVGMMIALAPVAVVSPKARTRLALLWRVIGIMLHGPAPWRARHA
jgi:hypothetical protein